MEESPTKQAFYNSIIIRTVPNYDGNVKSIIHLLCKDKFTKPYSHQHILVNLLTNAL